MPEFTLEKKLDVLTCSQSRDTIEIISANKDGVYRPFTTSDLIPHLPRVCIV